MASMDSTARVHAVRSFNRFYTKQIGVLQHGWLGSPFSLAEARVLYELAHHEQPTATDVGKELGLDAGYLSRMLHSFDQRGLVRRTRSNADGRRAHLSLTREGQAAFARLNQQTHEDVAAMLRRLSAGDQRRLVAAMHVIERLLGARQESPTSYVLRPPHAGDLGWIVHRQGAIYAEEWGYNEEFEALTAEIIAAFVQHLRPSKERCWIAEKDGEIVGSVFLVSASKTVAKLRLLLVEPSARGLGIGSRLIDECVRFARQAGYRKITLWTQSELKAARRLYKKAGFTLTGKKAHDSFGRKGLVAETWDLALSSIGC
jgi:DNA-binding MarR family transcriptional regulator/N-acetylglutamate synthase-like GNAT family acetyltransferase